MPIYLMYEGQVRVCDELIKLIGLVVSLDDNIGIPTIISHSSGLGFHQSNV